MEKERKLSFWVILAKFLQVVMVGCVLVFFMAFAVNCTAKKYAYPLKFKESVIESADEYGLSRALVFAVIKTESGFNKKAVSKKGAVGLMQILPTTADYIAQKKGIREYDLTDEKTNISFGCYYIRYLEDKFLDMKTALTAYNAGEGKVSEWLSDKEYSEDGKTLKIIPYKETEEYIEKIYESFDKYEKIYKNILDKR